MELVQNHHLFLAKNVLSFVVTIDDADDHLKKIKFFVILIFKHFNTLKHLKYYLLSKVERLRFSASPVIDSKFSLPKPSSSDEL